MQDPEFNEKVVPWTKSFAEDVDSRNAALQFTSSHLGMCRKRFVHTIWRENHKIHFLFSSSRSSFMSGQRMMGIVAFFLFLFIVANAWKQIDIEIFELNNKIPYKVVNFVGGMFSSRKDVN